jgi:hypothetical protein
VSDSSNSKSKAKTTLITPTSAYQHASARRDVRGGGGIFGRLELWIVVRGDVFNPQLIRRCLMHSYPPWEEYIECVPLFVAQLLRANEAIIGLYKRTFDSRITRKKTAWFAARREK